MSYAVRSLGQHLDADDGAKRILALDGGGLRGIVTLGFVAEIERILRERHGGRADFRLNHYFDLIAGTSTGAIIAAGLAQGMTVAELAKSYMALGKRVFERSLFRQGVLRAKFSSGKLIEELQSVFGEDTTLGDERLTTGLLVVTKRLDTGSPWPISNNPGGLFYHDRPDGVFGNGKYPLWQVVRASTAAPTFFDPERIEITPGVAGEFVDGGVSPFNNPALQALMYATMSGYRLGWKKGENDILLISVGTGLADPSVDPATLAATNAIKALASLMSDSADLVETLLQWMSASPTARHIDREIGDLGGDSLAAEPLMTYHRYNVIWSADYLTGVLGMQMRNDEPEGLCAMDDPDKMERLQEVGEIAGPRQVRPQHFPAAFDLVST